MSVSPDGSLGRETGERWITETSARLGKLGLLGLASEALDTRRLVVEGDDVDRLLELAELGMRTRTLGRRRRED